MKHTIHPLAADAASLAEGTSVHQARRRFLQRSIVLSGVIASGSVLALLAPTRTWALEAEVLNPGQAASLLAMAKRLYPHDGLSDAAYAMLVKDIDAACREDASVKDMIAQGVADLDRTAGGQWVVAAEDAQLRILTEIQDTAFFAKIRSQCIVSIYDNPIAYVHFGYEGETWSKGGYLARGFDDLVWLPDPPRKASPSMYDN